MDPEIKELKKIAVECRIDMIKALIKAESGHTAGPMGIVDFLVALYFKIMKLNPKKPGWSDRDRFVLSCGHYCPALYTVMAHRGYFPVKELMTLRQINTRLQGHPHNLSLPGIENTSGPLGQGLSQAVGMALAARLDKKRSRVYCLTSDGETQEGQIWEALMWAGANELDNLTVYIDRNFIQIDGNTEDVLALEPLTKKYQSFGWHVTEIDGHNFRQVIDASEEAKSLHVPTMIILHTIPGKDITEIENDFTWHGKPPTPKEGKEFLAELEKIKREL
jgi:transketolase